MFETPHTGLKVLAVIGLACLMSCSFEPVQEVPAHSTEIPEEIALAMHLQVEAWNGGNIDAFMAAGYLKSDQLMFVSSRGLTFSYNQVLENYHKAYPDGASRGVLQFENLKWVPLGQEHGLLVGKWMIDRAESEDVSGHYSLIWKKTSEGWFIIADHSS